MADQSDVEARLVQLVSDALYPFGAGTASALGVTCRVYRGWPTSAALDADLAAGRINVSVFPMPGQQRNTTRFADVWHAEPVTPALQAVVTGDIVRLVGRADPGQVVGLLVDGTAYRYVVLADDTPRRVARGLIGLLAPDRRALLLNETIRFPGVKRLLARVVCPVAASREVRRQAQIFRISFWCPDPMLRDQVVALADGALAGRHFMDLPDGSSARLRYLRTETIDKAEDAALYRRDLIYGAEFATLMRELQPAMLFGDLRVNDTPDRLA